MTGPRRPFVVEEKRVLLQLMRAELKGWRAVRDTLADMRKSPTLTRLEHAAVVYDLERVNIKCEGLRRAIMNLVTRIRKVAQGVN